MSRTMIRDRWLSLSLVIASALPWSLSLGVMGVWLIAEDHGGVLGHRSISLSAGIALLCSAQIVFLLCIADRVFGRAHRIVSRTIEGGLSAIFLGSIIVLAWSSVLEFGLH